MKKYKDLIAKSDEEAKKDNNSLQVETAELELKGHALSIKKAIASAKENVNKAKAAVPFSSRAVYVAKLELDKLERESTYLTELEKELF